MKIKELLIGLLIIIIPLSLLYICNKRLIKEQCDYNLTCIKNELENNIKNLDGVLVAPGFGERGIAGKLETIKYGEY